MATGVSALVITGIVIVATNSIQNSSYSRDKTLASNFVTETMEWLRKERDQNPDVFEEKAEYSEELGIPFCLPDLDSWPDLVGSCMGGEKIGTTKFTREVSFPSCISCPDGVIQAIVTVFWEDSKGKHSVSSSTDLFIK